jgi:hypothetical protein
VLVVASGLGTPAFGQPHFGVAEIETDSTGCVSTNGWRLASGDTLLIAMIEPPGIATGVVGRQLPGPCQPHGEVIGDSVFVYALHFRSHGEIEPGLGAGVLAPNLTESVDSTGVKVWISGEAQPYTFRYCTSMEGIHITGWHGQQRVWHEYYYLGYDVEPDCTDDEVGDDDSG